MIEIIINLPNGEDKTFKPHPTALMHEVVNAAKVLYPEWTSLVITVARGK